MTRIPLRLYSVIELCDPYFFEWWRLRIVERYPMHEVPNAWLMMQISIQSQDKTNPF